MPSIWEDFSSMPNFKSLENDICTDVLIIGGGICGLLCAWKLDQAGVDYVLLEANRICAGTTLGTTAKITALHSGVYYKISKKYGLNFARAYYNANTKAIDEYERLCKNIACDFERKDAYVYTKTDNRKFKKEIETLDKIGAKFEVVNDIEIPVNMASAIKFPSQAQFNPIKFCSYIAKNLNIYENSPVREFDGECFFTDKAKIKPKKTIVATHFPIFNKHGLFSLKMYQHRSYMCAFKNAPSLDAMYVDQTKDGLTFRQYNDFLIVGGGAHRTGKKGEKSTAPERFVKTHFENASLVARWSAQDCITLDSVPYIGMYSKNTPNLFVATGFNKWGITSSLVGASVLCDLVRGKNNSLQKLFDPSRTIFHPQLFLNVLNSIFNILTPTTPRCPHLGCALKYNDAEQTWDCPCHGSRFSKDGTVLNSPATNDLKLK